MTVQLREEQRCFVGWQTPQCLSVYHDLFCNACVRLRDVKTRVLIKKVRKLVFVEF